MVLTGLHFNPEAYQVMFDTFMDTVEKNWPDLMPQSIGFSFPQWREAPK